MKDRFQNLRPTFSGKSNIFKDKAFSEGRYDYFKRRNPNKGKDWYVRLKFVDDHLSPFWLISELEWKFINYNFPITIL